MFGPLGSLPPELVWGLFTRGLGLVFLISFVSLATQIVSCAGSRGGLPMGPRLQKMAQDFPTWRRFFYFPTLLWISHRDFMLRGLTLTGIAAACLVIYGGPLSFAALVVCYVCYLSLDLAVGLIFPWDCLLFETALLALFLPATHPLPELAAVAAPAPALAWAFRLLLFRVMFGFGKQKFIGSTRKDLAYIKGFLINQPLLSPIGWYMQKLPTVLLKPLVLYMFLVEIPVPFFAFIPGDLSIVCALATAFLMIGIQAMGSFGYFSAITIICCVPLLDNVTPTQLELSGMFAAGAPVFTNAYVVAHTLGALMTLPFNSWVAQIWHCWSFWYRMPRVAQLPFAVLRQLHPFRWLHPYGVFPPNVAPSVKISLLVEVSWDNETWHEEEFTYSPSNPRSAPTFVAPHHARGDQAVIYETFGLNPTSLMSSIVGPWDPAAFGAHPAANALVQRITEGHGTIFLKGTVLKTRKDPPVAARLRTVMLEPVSLKEHLASGRKVWWKRTYVGPHIPARGHDPEFWNEYVPDPEMWHFDAIFWRRRSILNDLMQRSLAGDEDPLQLAISGARDLSMADVDRFWNEIVPLVGLEQRKSFDTLPEVVARVQERYTRKQQRALHRVLGRLSLVLVARFEPLYLGQGLSPQLPAKTYFHLWMLAHHIMGHGKQAYLDAVANPMSAAKYLPELTTQTGLYYLSIFRYDSMIFEAQKLRLLWAISPPHDDEGKRRVAYSVESMGRFEKAVAKLAEAASGFFIIMPYIRDGFAGRRFERGDPEMNPKFMQLDSGEVIVREYAKPPPEPEPEAPSRAEDAAPAG